MSSKYLPTQDEPTPREILQALQKALHDNSSLKRASAEELARQLNIGGYLKAKPSPSLVADMLKVMWWGSFGLRSAVLEPCEVKWFWDRGINTALNLAWRGATNPWEEGAAPEKFTHTKTPPCTDLITDAEAVLRDKERWPIHLCEVEFMNQSTGLWTAPAPSMTHPRQRFALPALGIGTLVPWACWRL